MIQASWHNKRWKMDPQGIRLLDGASIEKALKVEEQEAKDGKNPTNTKGFEAQSISLNYTVSLMAGIDPRKELAEWDQLVGLRASLFIGGRRFGPPVLILDSVAFTGKTISPAGAIIAADFTLQFSEDIGAVPAPAAAIELYYGQNEKPENMPGVQHKSGVGSAYDIRPTAAAIEAMTSRR